jgi:monoamine oxidase
MLKSGLRAPASYSSKEYLDRLIKWPYEAPGPRSTAPKQVAIIGAGMAGLTCGWLLQRSGHQVKIFEASSVVGGRIKTLRDGFTNGFYAEAGAMRVPDSHTLTMWMINDLFELPTWEFVNACDNALIYINNERVTHGQCRDEKKALGFKLGDHEKGETADDLFEICVTNFIRAQIPELKKFKIEHLQNGSHALGKQRIQEIRQLLDRWSLHSFLMEGAYVGDKKKNKLTQAGADFISAALCLEMHLSCSMGAIMDDHFELHRVEQYYQIRGGMDALPKAFVGHRNRGQKKTITPNLMNNVVYNARVLELREKCVRSANENDQLKVSVEYENPGTHQLKTEDFDLVVIAVPFSALRHVRMRGLTGPSKRRALRQLHYDNSCKILLEFGRRFWTDPKLETGPITGGQSITDLAIRQTCYPIPEQNHDASGRGVLLASYTWGDDSLRWTSLKPENRIRFALRDLQRVHNCSENELEKIFTGGVSHSWADNEYTSGAFAMFEPFQLTTLFEDVWRPERLVHYCGEHTSIKHGWIEGAVESGIRVAEEICGRIASDADLSPAIYPFN